jgi:hypothetical protein
MVKKPSQRNNEEDEQIEQAVNETGEIIDNNLIGNNRIGSAN